MKNRYIEKILSALNAVTIHSPSSFSWFNEREIFLSLRLIAVLPAELLRQYMIETLQQKLYCSFYCKGYATPLHNKISQPSLISNKEIFINEISKANSGSGFNEGGWIVHSIRDSNVIVYKNGISISVDKKDLLTEPGDHLREGISHGIMMPKELKFFSPGFYIALGDIVLYRDLKSTLIRFYWNLRYEGAVQFMKQVTSDFNHANIPFRLKIVNHPEGFTRCDSVIVYANRNDYPHVKEIFENSYSKFLRYLNNEIPVFTKPLAFGLGLAEDPVSDTSFGLHRCRILAEGIVSAYEQNKKNLNSRLDTVIECFYENNIDLEKPYLNSGSTDIYDFSYETAAVTFNQPGTGIENNIAADKSLFLDTAFEIGVSLIQKAFWHDSRCSWMGMNSHGKGHIEEDKSNLAFKALGSDIYSGTSGIALFLAELYTLAGEEEIRRTSVGAVQNAISQASRLSGSPFIGLYDGLLGTVFSAAYIGLLLNEEELKEKAEILLYDIIRNKPEVKNPDLISGEAGIIIAFLMLHEILDNTLLQEFAVKYGEHLLQKAIIKDDQCSWKSANFPKHKTLTGFSHGTSGIAYALLELFKVTGDSKFFKSAEYAFNYERYWFNEERKNWPDFRGVPSKGKPVNSPFTFPVAWCHGAPGIALSRLHAYQLTNDNKYKSEALTALSTTKEWTGRIIEQGTANFSLCHGLAGNAEILLYGNEVLGHEFAEGKIFAEAAALHGINNYAKQKQGWPFGTLGSGSPGFMPGLSGVGYFYLRLFNPEAPSFLIFENKNIARRLNSLQYNSHDVYKEKNYKILATDS